MLGQRKAVIVIFFRAKATGRNSFISTGPYTFAVKKQRLSDGVWAAKKREAGCFQKDMGKEWKKKKIKLKRSPTGNGTGCRE